LANLEAIDPDSNNISGSIHSRVGSLTSLRYLDLSFNQINGSILYEIGNMENFKTLDLSSNNVYGSVPTMMCNLKALCPWVFHGLIPRLVGPCFINRVDNPVASKSRQRANFPRSSLSQDGHYSAPARARTRLILHVNID